MRQGAAVGRRRELQAGHGRADLYPGQRVTVDGFKPEIDGTGWLVSTVTHTIAGSGGFTTALELELEKAI